MLGGQGDGAGQAMRKLIAGNWKMNGLKADGLALARALVDRARSRPLACDLLICPPATLLMAVAETLAGSAIGLGGQDCHAARWAPIPAISARRC